MCKILKWSLFINLIILKILITGSHWHESTSNKNKLLLIHLKLQFILNLLCLHRFFWNMGRREILFKKLSFLQSRLTSLNFNVLAKTDKTITKTFAALLFSVIGIVKIGRISYFWGWNTSSTTYFLQTFFLS